MKRIEPIVKELLELYPKTRDDDFYLIGSVYFMLAPEIKSKSFLDIIKNHSFYGLPSFESITRARRKVQAENETVRTYTINVTREDGRSSNTNLSSISLSNLNINFNNYF